MKNKANERRHPIFTRLPLMRKRGPKMFKNWLLQLNPLPNWLHLVNRESLRADFFAGLTNAVVVLPQAVAFALIAGLPPSVGLYTAMITPIVAALFGSSHHAVSGPTTPVSITIFATISSLAEPGSVSFFELAMMLTFMVGVLQLSFGLARLGVLVNFISPTVIIGFTAGASILILNSQLKNILGLDIPSTTTFIHVWQQILQKIGLFNEAIFAVAAFTFFTAIFVKKAWPRGPNLLISMVVGSAFGLLLGGESVGISTIGHLESVIPTFNGLNFDLTNGSRLLSGAFAIAMLGLIQAVAISKNLAAQSGQHLDVNRQFVGEGMSNIIGSFFSCFVGTSSFTRSGLNYEAGAKTPMSAIFAAFLLFVILLIFSPLVEYLALPAMSGLIILIALNLIDWPRIRRVLQASRLETTVLGLTFFSTLLMPLEFAILLGALTSLTYFLYKTSHPHIAIMAPDIDDSFRMKYILRKPSLRECPQVKMARIDGPIFYGSIEHISAFFDEIREGGDERHCLILAEGVNFIGLAGADWLEDEARRWKEKGGGLHLCNLKLIAQDVLIRGHYKRRIGGHHFHGTKGEAIEEIYRQLDFSICAGCEIRCFRQCRAELTSEKARLFFKEKTSLFGTSE